jgi:hypothetical protein
LGEGGFGLDFEIPGLFKIVGVGDKVGFFLSIERVNRAKKQKNEGEKADLRAGCEE